MSKRAAWAAVIACSACTGSGELGEVTQAAQCPIWQCGSNSPEIAGHGFHELSEASEANEDGFTVDTFTRYGVSYGLDVRDGRLVGTGAGGVVAISAALGNLVDAQLAVSDDAGQQYLIRVAGVETAVAFWATLPVRRQPKLESYLLEWAETLDGINPIDPSDWANVCSNPPAPTDPDALGMDAEYTVLFDGERIDREAKRIGAALDDRWFNLGCAGHALAKLYLSGHTEAATAAGFSTTIDERQTMLKMLVADYCGTGVPYTVTGVPLSWQDDHGWMTHAPGVAIEARWGPDGATCLEQARIDANPNGTSTTVFPLGAAPAMGLDGCTPPPPCAPSTDPTDLDGHHLVTANP
jgi:hypothetical protein